MKYLNVSGCPLWSFEWANNGEAVLLLHGGLSDTESFAEVMVTPLQDSFYLFASTVTDNRSLLRMLKGILFQIVLPFMRIK
jgi:hypothetical protein